MQISCAVTAQLISAFVFATRIVKFLFHLYQKFQASSFILGLYSLVCVRPVRKPKLLVFSHEGSTVNLTVYVSLHHSFIIPVRVYSYKHRLQVGDGGISVCKQSQHFRDFCMIMAPRFFKPVKYIIVLWLGFECPFHPNHSSLLKDKT